MTDQINKVQKGPSFIEKVERVAKIQWSKFGPSHAPTLMLIGVQKGGTSSLHSYLGQHPNIKGAIDKEVHFFDRDNIFNRGVHWYESQFINLNPFARVKQYVDATPDYMYRPDAIPRMAQMYPNVKLVMILREPVSRAYSAWNMYRDFQITRKSLPPLVRTAYLEGTQNNMLRTLYNSDKFPSFEETVELELGYIDNEENLQEPSFLRRGFYMDQIDAILKYYDRNQLLVLGRKELKNAPVETLNRVLEHMGMPASSWDFLQPSIKNARAYKNPIQPETKERLMKYYEPHNERLFDFLGKSLW